MTCDRRSDAESRPSRPAHSSRYGLLRFAIIAALSLLAAAASLSSRAQAAETNVPTTEVTAAFEVTALDAELSAEESAAVARDEEAAAFAGTDDDATAADEQFAASADSADVALPDEHRADDELWMVSARRAKIVDGQVVGLNYWRYADGRWLKSSLEELVAADGKVPTCFHVHGNRVSLCEANFGGWHYYTTITAAGCRERGPLRWVIFTWPSDRLDCGPRKDVQIKAVRAECYGYYLAWVVDRLSADAQVSMVGYSFGTRLIGASLHYLGGGSLRGRKLAELQVENRHVRTVMLAAALDNNHFSPGHTMQMAPSQIDRLLLGLNPSDPALKWYALLYQITFRPRRGQQALGHSGVAGLNCSELNGRVEQRNMSCVVGREHDTHGFHYLTPWFVERMRTYVYFEETSGK